MGGGVNPLTLYMQKDKPRGGGRPWNNNVLQKKNQQLRFGKNGDLNL